MTFRSQVLTGFAWVAGTRMLAQLGSWAVTIVVIRLLTPADYGLLAMATTFTAFLALTSELGLGPAVVQAAEIDRVGLKRVFGLVLVMNAMLMAVLFLAAPFIAMFFEESRLTSIIRVLALQFGVNAFAVIPIALIQRNLDFKRSSLVGLGEAIASSLTTLALAYAGYGVWALVLGTLTGSVLRSINVNLIAPFFCRPDFSLQGMRSLIRFGGNITASRLIWFFYSQADVLIAGKLLGKELLGFYSVSMQLASLPVQRVSSMINQVAYPAFARLQGDPTAVGAHALKAMRLLAFVGFPLFFGVSSVATELIGVLLGPKWNAAIVPLQVLCLIMPLRMISNFLPSPLDAIGRPDISLRNLAWASVIMPSAFLIGSNWGLLGLSLAWVLAFPVVFSGNILRCFAALKLPPVAFVKVLAVPALSSALMYGVIETVRPLVNAGLNGLSALLSLIAVGVVCYVFLAAAFNREVVREFLGILKG